MSVTRGNGGNSSVVRPAQEEQKTEEYPIIRFTVRPQPRVNFAAGTIDNENMGKRKSKLCCIYNKPTLLDSSSSSGEEEHDCHGHGHNRYDRYPKHQRRTMREQAAAKKNNENAGQIGDGKKIE